MRSPQVRGRPQEAAEDVRTLLDLMRDNAAEDAAAYCKEVLEESSQCLKILDPEVGDEELIKAVALAKARLRSMVELSQLQEGPGPEGA